VKKKEVSLSKENRKCKGTKVGKNMELGKRAKKSSTAYGEDL